MFHYFPLLEYINQNSCVEYISVCLHTTVMPNVQMKTICIRFLRTAVGLLDKRIVVIDALLIEIIPIPMRYTYDMLTIWISFPFYFVLSYLHSWYLILSWKGEEGLILVTYKKIHNTQIALCDHNKKKFVF
jgi:hypothetical protein